MTRDLTKAESLFAQAIGIESAAERAAFLEQACGDDPKLQGEVAKLVGDYFRAGGFLEKPAVPGLATVDVSPTGERVGTLIGPYKLVQEIGEGGMGTVWMAQQTEPVKRLVALKLIKPGMDSRQVIARFEAERQALALMDHPNIAKVHDAGTAATGTPYFVMELVKGVPITRYCDEHRLTPKERLELFVPVCQAVQHAHQKGIIHRDLKPSNVLVASYDGKPVPKVIDFGIAKATGQQLTEKTLITGFGNVVGTLEYMSPEQAELNQLDIDTRSDIYSLGVLLYELLTGSTPLDKKRLHQVAMLEVLRIIREEEPPRPSTRLSTTDELPAVAANRGLEPKKLSGVVRGELDWIVMKALEKDRNRRYETANGFAMDVQRYLADEPVLACPPSAAYRLRKFVRRHQAGLVMTATLLLVVLLAGGGIGWVLWDRAEHQEAQRIELAARRAETERTVTIALGRAAELSEQAQKMPCASSVEAAAVLVVWQKAQDALARTETALTTGADDDGLRQRVAELRAQLDKGQARAVRKEQLFRDLDEARLAHSVWVDGHFDFAGYAGKYAAAFAAFGLDVTPERNDDLAQQIAAEEPEVREALLVALLDWASAAHQASKGSGKSLFALALMADSSQWRKRYITAWAKRDWPALHNLSSEARRSALPPSSLNLLALSLFAIDEQEGVALLRWGRGRHPSDFWLHYELGNRLLNRTGNMATAANMEEAIGCYRAALALRPATSAVHYNLGCALRAKGQLDEAIDAFRDAIRLQPDNPSAHTNLGLTLLEAGRPEEAIAELREALRTNTSFREAYKAHCNLGLALLELGRWDEAIAEYRKAIPLMNEDLAKPDLAGVHLNLGNALAEKGQLNDAIDAYRQAISLKKDYAEAHYSLGNALFKAGRPEEAITAFRDALSVKKDYAEAHYNLGCALGTKGERDEAITAYRAAIRLKPDYAQAHCNLGSNLKQKGQFREALEELRRGHDLGSRTPSWRYPSAQWVRECERLIELDAKLPAILEGKTRPASADERIELAVLCSLKGLHRAAAGFYEEAFAEQPKLADDLAAGHRYDAACAAALAGCGKGEDAGSLDDKENTRWRSQALSWLRADLVLRGRQLASGRKPADQAEVQDKMRHWLADVDFAGVRGADVLARLPAAEREPWQTLWTDVTDLLARAQANKPQKKSDPK
jgi:serine/threonine protein kinase/tetratricopeptide (TPR) repeat protein